jgi:hypothetical protein
MQNNIPTVHISEIHCCIVKSSSLLKLLCRFVQKYVKKNNLKLSCCHGNIWRHNASLRPMLPNYEYFMLNHCLEKIGGGLLHACISSVSIYANKYSVIPTGK